MDFEPRSASREGSSTFVELWRDELPRLSAFCRWRCAGTAADPDEVLSTTAIRAWRSFASLREPDRFGAWIRRIAAREASHARRRRQAALVAETAHHAQSDVVGPDAQDGAPPPISMIAVTRAALAARYLSVAEATVVVGRLASADTGSGWEAVSDASGLSREVCALHFIRAVPKLRLYILLAHPEVVGGRAAIGEAFASACTAKHGALAPLEAEAFRHEVIERQPARRSRGWAEALRGAAAKVMRFLPQPLP